MEPYVCATWGSSTALLPPLPTSRLLHGRENWSEMMGVVAGSSNLSSRKRAVCHYLHQWALGLSTSTSVFHGCVFSVPSMLCFDWWGFTKTRKERILRVGLCYQLVWHKEGRAGDWFAGALYDSSTVSPHCNFNDKEVWMRYQAQAHTPSVHRGQTGGGSCSHTVGGPPR